MTVALFSTLLLGVLLGIRHATDADHVLAVTAIVTRRGRPAEAIRIGALWAAGHTVTILLVGGAIILLHVVIPPRLGLAMEFGVALMLIGLGANNLLGDRPAPPTVLSAVRPVVVGVVHGLAGSAAVALLVLATIPDPRWGVAYLLLFGGGTVVGMVGVTALVASPLARGVTRCPGWRRSLQLAAGTLSLSFGLFLATRIAIVGGLFSTAPHWVPR